MNNPWSWQRKHFQQVLVSYPRVTVILAPAVKPFEPVIGGIIINLMKELRIPRNGKVGVVTTDFRQTGFTPVEGLLVISKIPTYPIPCHTASDGVSRPQYGQKGITGSVHIPR